MKNRTVKHELTPLQQSLFSQLIDIMLVDKRRLSARIHGIGKIKSQEAQQAVAAEIQQQIEQARLRVEQRKSAVKNPIVFPESLPVSQRKAEIEKLLSEHQVIVVAGETGSGKTTQLPKMCLELGFGNLGTIGHTQPRRIAARSVAARIAEELQTELGDLVGYKVRFNDQISDNTQIKLMTDGILLAEIQTDRFLNQYSCLIIDEAHERSLNNDFILGYLKQLLPRRPDLKVIITSATIDVERFSKHFNSAPIIEVSGRTYPVEVRYRPVAEEDDQDQLQGILNAVDELQAEGRGDILIFMNGEREIRDTAEALQKQNLKHTEILPLFARLSAQEQNKIFHPSGLNRIVLATNVAETSLTVPGIKYVIDPGTARISRYSYRTKVQRLPIEPISQASANQRKGRCGRVSEGICIRLYSEEDFNNRPEFTDPEILRTNLASVILQMTALGLDDIEAFPFVDAPDKRHIQDGVKLLEELGAFETVQTKLGEKRRLTTIGRQLAQLPVDPRLAKMLLSAVDFGSVYEVMIIVSALSIQDPRERPTDKQQASDEKHRRFADKKSDFLAFLNLWHYVQEQQKELTKNQFRRQCQKDFLNYLRIREWQDIYQQIRLAVREAKAKGYDVVIIDTAGRLAVDEEMMTEISNLKNSLHPDETLFVVDSMTGQDAVNTAKEFNDRLDFDGVVLTKLDGDTRGGAALSIRTVVTKPIKFVGTGEKMEAIDVFHPARMADRILGMGDIVSLVERAQEQFDEEEAKRLQKKIQKNKFDFNDFLGQIEQIKKMGNLKDLASMIPGVGKAIKDVDIDDNAFKGIEAIIKSMTPKERTSPEME